MSSWDEDIFADEVNVDFLDELADLEDEEIVAAVDDACALAVSGEEQTEEEQRNALAAATIAAIWAGAPFSAGEVVEDYPFIRDLAGSGSEKPQRTCPGVARRGRGRLRPRALHRGLVLTAALGTR